MQVLEFCSFSQFLQTFFLASFSAAKAKEGVKTRATPVMALTNAVRDMGPAALLDMAVAGAGWDLTSTRPILPEERAAIVAKELIRSVRIIAVVEVDVFIRVWSLLRVGVDEGCYVVIKSKYMVFCELKMNLLYRAL
jgi:hypothetical protein